MNTNNSELLRSKHIFSTSPTSFFPSLSFPELSTPTSKILSPFESFLCDKDLFVLDQFNPSGIDLKSQEQEEPIMQSLIASLFQSEKQDEANPFAFMSSEEPDALKLLFSTMDTETLSNNSKAILSKNSSSSSSEKERESSNLCQASSSSKKESKKSAVISSKKEKVPTIAGLPAADVDTSRTWATVSSDPNFDIEVKIFTKTRKDEPSELFPNKIYASLKYEIIEEATGNCLKDSKFLHSKCFVVYSDNYQPVEKTNTVKYVLKGVTEGALTKTSGDKFDGRLKIQIDNNLSTHSAKREYCVEIHFFHSENLEKPILIKRSPQFKAYARRPNKPPKRSASDRIATADYESEQEDEFEVAEAILPPTKKIKSEYDEFVEKLEDLIALRDKLNEEDKLRASSLLLQQFSLVEQLFR